MTDTHPLSASTLALVVLAHLGIFATMASLRTVSVQTPGAALMVSVIQSDTAAPKAPVIKPVRSQKIDPPAAQPRSQAVTPAPVLAAAETPDAAQAISVAKAVQPSPAPSAQAVAPTAAPSSTAKAAATAAPRFDANYLDNPAPAYPSLSRRSGEEGKVVLRVFVAASGRPDKIEIHASSGFERLDKSASSAVARWKFIPAQQGADAVGAWVLVPIVFSLKV